MASHLTRRTLTKLNHLTRLTATTTTTTTTTATTTTTRRRSVRAFSQKPQLIELELDSPVSSAAANAAGLKRLEDAIHSIIVRRLEPGWLAFRPGSSYWVPSSRSVADTLVKLVDDMGIMSNPLSDDESMALVTSRGWPCSHYFLHQEIQIDSSIAHTDADLLQHAGKLNNSLTEEESLCLISAHGWPSSSHFLYQGSPTVTEVNEFLQKPENAQLAEEEE